MSAQPGLLTRQRLSWGLCWILALSALSALSAAQAQPLPQAPVPGQSPSQPAFSANQPIDATPVPHPASSPPLDVFSFKVEGPPEVTDWLLEHLQLQRYKGLQDLDEPELQRLLQSADEQARDLLATLGYFSPDLRWQTLPGDAPGPAHRVSLTVAPGVQSQIKAVQLDFEGEIDTHPDTQSQKAALRQQWTLPVGHAFTQAAWSQAKSLALRQLMAENYPLATLSQSQAQVDADTHAVALTLTLDSGPRVLLGPPKISGNERYDVDMATRLARIPLGKPYRQSDLLEAQQRLVVSGFYDSVFVALDPEGPPQAMPVNITLKEALRQKWVVGLGVRSDNGPRMSAEYTHHRVPGLDWRAVTKVAVDKTLQTLSLDLLGLPDADLWRWTSSGKLEHQTFTGYEVSSQRLRAGRIQLAERIDRIYYAQYDQSHTLGSLSDTRESLSANYAWTWRRFDSLPFPNQGWGFGLEVGSGVTLGQQHTPFARWVGKILAMQPLGDSAHKLSLRGEMGGVATQDASNIPTTQLFLAGGDGSVRGYALSSIGVQTLPGVISAGRYLASGSVEWQIPIYRQSQRTDWEGVVFVDAGAVANTPSALRAHVGAGVGARWRSPVGPLQIDLAQAQDTHQWRLHMSVGFKF